MNRDHIRYALIALALALMAINASLLLGLQEGENYPIDHNLDHIDHISINYLGDAKQ